MLLICAIFLGFALAPAVPVTAPTATFAAELNWEMVNHKLD